MSKVCERCGSVLVTVKREVNGRSVKVTFCPVCGREYEVKVK